MRENTIVRTVVASAALALASCGGGGGGGDNKAAPPPAPTGAQAAPANGQATLSWNASPGATGYNVYHGLTSTVTPSSTRVGAAGSPAAVTGLTNGTSYWFAVSAVGPGGESELTPGGCAVPTAASQAGLTLRDPLCAGKLSGTTWWPNGAFSVLVSGGEALLGASMDAMEPYAANGAQYAAFTNVAAGGSRVTTLRARLRVPAASATRSGTDPRLRAGVRLQYSPPDRRLNFPGANQDLINFEVGLLELGGGLMAIRQVTHCDSPSCASFSPSGVAFADPPGFAPIGGGEQAGVAAAYDAVYTFEVRLAEAEGTGGIFHWSMTGGSFGSAVLSGTADPALYLAGAAGWSGVPLSGAGFANGQLSARVLDRSATGGGSARINAYFDDVWVGMNDGAAARWDDFGGAGGNSGPVELSAARWANPGAMTVGLAGGAMALHAQATSTGGTLSLGQGLALANPASVNTLQADLRVVNFSAGSGGGANARVEGRFYNDGTAGAAPHSAVGDVLASVFLYPGSGDVHYGVSRCLTANCGTVAPVESGPITGATPGAGVHAVRVRWDPAAKRFTFACDGFTATVDPTGAAPVAGPANAPHRRIFTGVGTPATAGAAGLIDVRVNNLFTAP